MHTLLLIAALSGAGFATSAAEPPAVIHLFNGRDLTGFYTFLKDRGRGQDPKGVFTVQDGQLRISGEEFGCVTTEQEFDNYRLVVEFRWGDKTWAPRENSARDSGVLLHSVGEDGAYGGIWMHSIECQLIEGGTGDFIVVGDDSGAFAITCPVADEESAGCPIYAPEGKPKRVTKGRVNWFGRDPGWKDTKGFRGAKDVEKPAGGWNVFELISDAGRIKVMLNGVLVNECSAAQPSKGRIQIQSEAAEIFFRRVDLYPLGK